LGKRDGAEEAEAHVKECKDSKKMQAHQRQRRIEAEAAAVRTQKRAAQDEVGSTLHRPSLLPSLCPSFSFFILQISVGCAGLEFGRSLVLAAARVG
jgi:hypothetical protein